MLNVLLVEDEQDLAATLVQYLALENIRCDHASNGVAGLNLAQQHNYDVLLLDLNLPRLDGISLCQQLRQAGDDTPVLMLTARDQLSDKLEGFHAGTDDFLVKPFELQELVFRIKALARRRSAQAKVLRCADLTMDLTNHSLIRAGTPLKVSPFGWRLLELLLRASPAVVTKQQLEEALWGEDCPDSNSLKVHMFHLRKTIDAPFSTSLLHTISGRGFAIRATHAPL